MAADSNCSSCLSEESLWRNFSQYFLYIAQGVLLATGNLIVFFAIMRQPMMRIKKEYIVVAGLSFVNGLNGVATIVGGTGRNILIYTGVANVLVSRWQCFRAPWNLMWHVTHSLIPVMLVVCSIDRLYAVCHPVRFFKADWHYALGLVGAGYCISLAQMAIAAVMTWWYSSEHQDDLVPQTCMIGWSSNPYYHAYLVNQRLVCSGVSVFLYVFVLYFYNSNKNKVSAVGRTSHQIREQKKQRKITISLAVSALVTLLFFFAPLIGELFAVVVFNLPPDIYTYIAAYMFLLNNIDALLDFFIFTLRHKEMMTAVKYLFICKTMSAVQNSATPTNKHKRQQQHQSIRMAVLAPMNMGVREF